MAFGPWIIWLGLAVLSLGIDEWNPRIESDSLIIGPWRGGGYEIDLEADLTFTLSSGDKKTCGRWKRDDWNLHLSTDDHDVREMRFVEDGGELLLLPDPPQIDMTNTPGPIMKRPWSP